MTTRVDSDPHHPPRNRPHRLRSGDLRTPATRPSVTEWGV
ncbi:hypothetical protein SBD_2656 [Streptomyces bottropensis ATCC 25435]|uniref:Uncharacterized protein n=1 Tax=Streptomyces bottropensis ATCC 25435 TaxID=1054862 RepID=M3EGE3_9ACTN|nr:hypothetical protein SBD_2656 [Streptomyces bottropensis ATCC 25435]